MYDDSRNDHAIQIGSYNTLQQNTVETAINVANQASNENFSVQDSNRKLGNTMNSGKPTLMNVHDQEDQNVINTQINIIRPNGDTKPYSNTLKNNGASIIRGGLIESHTPNHQKLTPINEAHSNQLTPNSV